MSFYLKFLESKLNSEEFLPSVLFLHSNGSPIKLFGDDRHFIFRRITNINPRLLRCLLAARNDGKKLNANQLVDFVVEALKIERFLQESVAAKALGLVNHGLVNVAGVHNGFGVGRSRFAGFKHV